MKQPIKRDFDQLNLRGAFRDEPEKCHQALMTAVHSVKEEEKESMKHLNFRPLLVAAIIIVSMVSVAFAASEIFGLNDYWKDFGISLTQDQQQALKPDKETAWQLGPMTFMVQERVADPYYAYISTSISVTDESPALVCMDMEERLTDAQRTALGLELVTRDYGEDVVHTQPTYLEAAQQTGLPLYMVRAIMEVPEEMNGGEGMEDVLHTSTACVYINQQTLQNLNGQTELPAQIFLRVSRIDPTTCEEAEKWTSREPYAIPVSKLLDEGCYQPETPLVTGDMTLTEIRTALYETGMYVYRQYQMPADLPCDENYPVWEVTDATPLLTADGTPFMSGISLSGLIDFGEWPTVSIAEMVTVTELPPIIQVGGVNYTLQAK